MGDGSQPPAALWILGGLVLLLVGMIAGVVLERSVLDDDAPAAPAPSPPATASPTPQPIPIPSPQPTARPTTAAPDEATDSPTPAHISLAEARRLVSERGYRPKTVDGWRPQRTLKVITAERDSATGRPEFAFFFAGGRLLGTDTAEPSAGVSFTERIDDTTVRLTYALYAPDEPMCCPSSTADVRYRWDGDRLRPLDPIPSNDPDADRSRR